MKEINKITLLLKIGLIITLFYMCRMQPHRTKQSPIKCSNYQLALPEYADDNYHNCFLA